MKQQLEAVYIPPPLPVAQAIHARVEEAMYGLKGKLEAQLRTHLLSMDEYQGRWVALFVGPMRHQHMPGGRLRYYQTTALIEAKTYQAFMIELGERAREECVQVHERASVGLWWLRRAGSDFMPIGRA